MKFYDLDRANDLSMLRQALRCLDQTKYVERNGKFLSSYMAIQDAAIELSNQLSDEILSEAREAS